MGISYLTSATNRGLTAYNTIIINKYKIITYILYEEGIKHVLYYIIITLLHLLHGNCEIQWVFVHMFLIYE